MTAYHIAPRRSARGQRSPVVARGERRTGFGQAWMAPPLLIGIDKRLEKASINADFSCPKHKPITQSKHFDDAFRHASPGT